MSRYHVRCGAAALAFFAIPSIGRAQMQAMHGHNPNAALHIQMTAARPATPADSARADSIVSVLRVPLEPYRDVRRAEADGDGRWELAGAMYNAPGRTSLASLDARVPLGIARWHRHVNWCLPPLGHRERWTEKRDGIPVFGPLSPIATRETCEAAGGVFHPGMFGWMVHVDPFPASRAAVWGEDH